MRLFTLLVITLFPAVFCNAQSVNFFGSLCSSCSEPNHETNEVTLINCKDISGRHKTNIVKHTPGSNIMTVNGTVIGCSTKTSPSPQDLANCAEAPTGIEYLPWLRADNTNGTLVNIACNAPSFCNGDTPNISLGTINFFLNAGQSQGLRPYFCVDSAAPYQAPQYIGDQLKAYQWISNQADPACNGNIRSVYNGVNVTGSLNRASTLPYDSSCGCTENNFNTVQQELAQEISAVQNITGLFSSIRDYYINPLFIANTELIVAAVSELELSNQPAVINTGAVIENSVFKVLEDVFNTAVGTEISPWGSVAISALLNWSTSAKGGIPQTIHTEASNLENKLPQTFLSVLKTADSLETAILND